MNPLIKWLTLLHGDCKFKVKFRTLDKEKYEKDWEALNMSCVKVKIPEFFCKGIDLSEIEENLKSTYAELQADNSGYKQPHEYILTGVTKLYNNNILLSFSSKFSNWAVKRNVVINPLINKIVRNDFNDVYELSWKDYKEGSYQKKKAVSNAPKLRRPTLTQDNK